LFIKPSTSIAGFDEDVPIPKIAQDGTIDYEGELVCSIPTLRRNVVDFINRASSSASLARTSPKRTPYPL
jgi:2-keto-4-pentenoate hydratase/2-oxohepta-3-ene-1,7-dioic acid hydratase in catechol pathway